MSKYFVVIDKNMAGAIKMLTGKSYYTFDHDRYKNVYSFVRCEEVERAYSDLGKLIKDYRE